MNNEMQEILEAIDNTLGCYLKVMESINNQIKELHETQEHQKKLTITALDVIQNALRDISQRLNQLEK